MTRKVLALLLCGVIIGVGLFLSARVTRAADEPKPDAIKPEAAKADTAKPVVPVFLLDAPLSEAGGGESIPLFSPPGLPLRELVSRMDKAKDDPAVKAVVLMCEAAGWGRAQAEEIRQAMDRLKAAGKDVYAHTDSAGTGEYLVLSGATRVSASPGADFWLTGLFAEQPYVRGLLDKLGVVPDYLTCGDYKSAAEMFMRSGPSPAADRMTNWLLDGIYDAQLDLIAKGRKLERAKVREIIDNGPYTAETAQPAGLVDVIEHRQDFEKFLREKYGKDVVFNRKYGQKKPPQIDLSSPFGLMKFMSEAMGGGAKQPKPSKPSVAIVYVEGPIVPGEGGGVNPLAMGGPVAASSPVRRALEKAALDDTVKAVVLRVSSPGGSAVASEIILDATRRVKAKKPFIVSMGDVAGSGGYYVSMGADTIYADEATITASIGVVAGKFATNDMWAKAGITFKGYARGKHSGVLSSEKPFTPEEREKLQSWMDSIYGTFKKHVQTSRGGKLKKPLDEITGGRVYTGKQALELGLVDKIGSLRDAIEQAAGEAKFKAGEYEVRTIPEAKNPLEALLSELAGGASQEEQNGLVGIGGRRPRLPAAPALRGAGLLELAEPHLRQLDPHRVAAVRAALVRLEMLQREGALLMMPEIVVSQ